MRCEAIMVVAHGDAELAGFEAEAGAEFEQGRFEIALGVLRQRSQVGEFEDVGIADQVFDGFLRLLSAGALDDGSFVFGKTGALKEERTDLALKLAHGPVALETFVFVEGALERVGKADEFENLRPREVEHGLGGKWGDDG